MGQNSRVCWRWIRTSPCMAARKKLRTAAPPTVYPFIGSGVRGHEDGPVATAKLRHAQCTLPLAEGYLVADLISVRLVSDDGIVTTLAGGDEEGFADGVGAAARFNYITGVAPHPDGGWVVCDSCNAFAFAGLRLCGGWRALRGLRAVGGRIMVCCACCCGVLRLPFSRRKV